MIKEFLKNTAAGLLTLLIVAGTTPVAPFAKMAKRTLITASAIDAILSGKCGENASWEFAPETGKLTIKGSGKMYSYSSSNQPWKKYLRDITSVEIKMASLQ